MVRVLIHGRMSGSLVFGLAGAVGSSEWSVGSSRRVCGGLQCHMRGYIWLYGCYSMVSEWY